MTLPPLSKYHQHQGATNDCAPHTVAIVVNAFRDQSVLEGSKIAKIMNRPRLCFKPVPVVIRRIPNWATFPWGIVDALREHGIRARWRFGAGPADLYQALNAGRVAMPIIGEWRGRRTWAHVKPLVEIDSQQGYAFVDPAKPHPLSWQTKDEFERLWKNFWNLLVETL